MIEPKIKNYKTKLGRYCMSTKMFCTRKSHQERILSTKGICCRIGLRLGVGWCQLMAKGLASSKVESPEPRTKLGLQQEGK